MSRPRKLGLNEKDESAQKIPEEDSRRDWVSADPLSTRNANPRLKANQRNTGFSHLNITAPAPVDGDEPLPQPPIHPLTPEQEAVYLSAIVVKLTLAKACILNERRHGLPPDRPNMNTEPAAAELAEPPVPLDMQAQHMLRTLLDKEDELRRINDEAQDEDREEVLVQPMTDYLLFWNNLKTGLALHIPGGSVEEREEKADRVMDEALEKIVEP